MFSFFKKKPPRNFDENIQLFLKKYNTYYTVKSLLDNIDNDQRRYCPREIYESYLQLKGDIDRGIAELNHHDELFEILYKELETAHKEMERSFQMQESLSPVRNMDAIVTLDRNLPGLKSAIEIKIKWF
jgi:hypothetical protein